MAQDIILAIVPTIVEHTVAPIKRHICYAFNYKTNVENLKTEIEKLTYAREGLQHSVDDDLRNGKNIEQNVQNWLIKVNEITEKARKLIEDEDKANKKCFVGLCPNFRTRYLLSRETEKRTMAMSELWQEGKFDRVSYRAPLEGIGAMSIQGYVGLQSRMSVFDQIMDVLTGFEIGLIGVYGIGGVGKTTLVKKVARKAIDDKLFDAVVMATITDNPDLMKIQGEIADALGLKFDEESERGRARRLYERLKKANKVLVILDDLWKRLDLEAVGIPFKDDHKGCKILLTARSLKVLSTEMDCQKNFPIDVLPEEEARDLFKKMVGDNFENPDFHSTAIEVVNKCAGLPVVIVTVARALRSESLDQWKNAVQELKRPSSNNFTDLQEVKYSAIRFSYNHLKGEKLQSAFLLCSLMGNNASTRDLLKYGISLGLFGASVTVEEVQNSVRSLVHNLKTSCLLLDGGTTEQFAMHDVVRDVAMSIASTDHHVFIRSDGDELKEWPDKDCKKFWLHCNISELPEELECPRLDFFYIHCKDPNIRLPDSVFRGFHELKVLVMIDFSFSSLPSSLTFLENLQTLCLEKSVLGDMAFIGKLKKLEVLSFVKSSIKHLPGEIGQLTKLRLLDLSDCSQLEVIPPNVLSRLSSLEELYMGNSFDQWEIERLNGGQKNASLAELKHLSHLTNLEIHVKDVRVLSMDLVSRRLQRYRIFIGDDWDWDGVYKTSRTLKLKLNTRIHLEYEVRMLLKRSEDLYLYELKDVKNVLYELDSRGFPQLKHLNIVNCSEIQHIVNRMERFPSNSFPMLESLYLRNLISLEKICYGKLRAQSFGRLRTIKVRDCDNLKNLFSFSLAQSLSQLQKIKVHSCKNIEDIVADESEAYVEKNEAVDKIEFTQLHSLSLGYLPLLRRFCSKEKKLCLSRVRSKLLANDETTDQTEFHQFHHPSLKSLPQLLNCFSKVKMPCLSPKRSKLLATDVRNEGIILDDEQRAPMPLFNEKIFFPNLEELDLLSINVETLWDCQLPSIASSLQNLTKLHVGGCHSLKYLFSSSMVKSLVQLKNLGVWDCMLIEEVIVMDESIGKMMFPKLDFLWLYNLPKLKHFCGGYQIECPMLKSLNIERCPELKTFISDSMITNMVVRKEHEEVNSVENLHTALPLFDEKVAFPNLTEMGICSMDNLEKIWHNQLAADSFCTLRRVGLVECEKLLNIFPSSMTGRLHRLEQLHVRRCSSLKEIVEKKENAGAAPYFMFPKLTSLKLIGLLEFRSFYPGTHTSEWPMLKKLKVGKCEIVQFALNFLNFQEIHGEGHLDTHIRQPLSLVEMMMPNLEELSLDGDDATTSTTWLCQFLAELLSKLKFLELRNFRDKSDVTPFSFIRRFHNLETLLLRDSAFKVLFSYEALVAEEEHAETLERLRNLKVVSVDDLTHIWAEDCQLVPLLQNLQTLKVSSCDSLVNLVPSSASFQNLTSLDVSFCHGLLNMITFSAAKSLVRLIELRVRYCNAMTEVVAKQGDETTDENEMIFSKLKSLVLVGLRNLISFFSGNLTLKFPSLEQVIVCNCPKMTIFSPADVIAPKLRKVQLKEYSEDEMRWEQNLNITLKHLYAEMAGFNGQWNLKLSEFPQLKDRWHGQLPFKCFSDLISLTIDECAFFSNAIPSNLLPVLKYLRELDVQNCNSLEGIFDLDMQNVEVFTHLLPKLAEFRLIDLPRLRHIWNKDPRGILVFKNLGTLKIDNCSSLRNILTPSMAMGLVQLKKIEIRNCIMMEEIIAKESAGEVAMNKITFPLLENIVLESLPNLTVIFPGSGVFEFPSITEITIDSCPNMKRLILSILLSEQEPKSVDEGSDLHTAPLVNDEVSFSKLEKLRVEWNNTMEEIWHRQLRADVCCKLKFLELRRFPNAKDVFPTSFLQKFPNLENLVVNDAFFKEIVLNEKTNDEEHRTGALANLKGLKLSKLPRLTHMSKEDSQSCLVFQALESLEVLECDELKILVPSSMSFQCLMTLEVSKCHGLTNLITSKTAESLMQLTRMSITECKMIEEIVVGDKNEARNEVTFSKLKFLELRCLPSLTSFYSRNHAMMFPCLTNVLVGECPKMKFFTLGVIRAPKLKRLELPNKRRCWEGNLNATIEHLFTDMNEAVVQSKLLCSSRQSTSESDSETAKAKKDRMLADSNGLDSQDLCVTENSDGSKDQLSEVETTIKLTLEEQAIDPEILQMGSTHQSQATSNDKEHPIWVTEESEETESGDVPLVRKSKAGTQHDSILTSTVAGVKTTLLELGLEPNSLAPQPPLDGPESEFFKEVVEVSASVNFKTQDSEISDETITKILVTEASLTDKSEIQVEERVQPSPLSRDSKAMASSSSPLIIPIGVPPMIPTYLGTLTPSMLGPTISTERSSSIQLVSRNLLTQLSSMTETQKPFVEAKTSGSSLASEYDYLQQQRKILRDYFNMSLEAIQEANAFEDIERIARSLIQHSSSLYERSNLENFLSRLTEFREKVSHGMRMITAAHYEKSMKLESNLSQRQGQLGALEAKLSNLEIEIQRLISKKEVLLDLLEKTNEKVSKDLAEWQNQEEEAKQARDNFYKGKEILIQANASWAFIKQRLGLE